MKKLNFFFTFKGLLVMVCLSLFLTGCQSGTPIEQPTQQVPEVPFSQGPTSPPSVKGPSEAVPNVPPADHDQPQAITEKETIRYTLPTSDTPPRFRQ